MAIPKIIHYCWFGGNPLPELALKCIASWKKKCPDYELMLWNEENFDLNTIPFTKQAVKAKKWAFINDYIKGYSVYYYGGINLDVDVELLKPLDENMLRHSCFGGFEDGIHVAPGLVFAGEKGSIIAKDIMDFYGSYNFIKKNGELNLTPSPKIFTNILLKYGLKQDDSYQELGIFTVYPSEYFCAKNFYTGKIKITEHTYSIHYYDGSWTSDEQKEKTQERWDFYSKYGDDEYLVNLYETYHNEKKLNINNVSLRNLYKIGIQRTIKKIKNKFL
jgi:mannosyltransferase OCH1-like enzyme